VFIADPAQGAHEFRRRQVEATLTLDWFDDDGGNVFCLDINFENGVNGRQRILDRNAMVRNRKRRVKHTGYRHASTRFVRDDLAG